MPVGRLTLAADDRVRDLRRCRSAAAASCVRVDVDADGELLRAEDVDLRDAADHREPLRERRSRRTRSTCDSGSVGELSVRNRIGESAGLTFWNDGGDGMSGRQLPRGARDHRLHVLRGGVDVAVQIELQRDVRAALRVARADRRDAGNRRELLLERRRDRRRHRLRAGAGQVRR